MDAVQTAFIWKKLSAVLKSKKQRIPTLYFGFITIEVLFHSRALEVYLLPIKMHPRLMRDRFFRSSRYPPDYLPHLDNVRMLPSDLSKPVTQKPTEKLWCPLRPRAPSPGIPSRLDKSKAQLRLGLPALWPNKLGSTQHKRSQ